MILATAQFADWSRFWEAFSTVGAERRAEHGCNGALLFRDADEPGRVWIAFDWDEPGWASFVADSSNLHALTFLGAIEA